MRERYYEILVVPVASLLKWDDYGTVSFLCASIECAKDIAVGLGYMLPESEDVTIITIAGLYGVEQFYNDDFYEDLGEILAGLSDRVYGAAHKSLIAIYGSSYEALEASFMPGKLNPLMKRPGRFVELRWLMIPLIVLGGGESVERFIGELMDKTSGGEDSEVLVNALKNHLGHKLAYILPPMLAEEGLDAIIEVQEAITGFFTHNMGGSN